MTKDKALNMAIEQMQHLIKIYIPSLEWSGTAIQEDCYEAIQACKEALAQPAQEEVPKGVLQAIDKYGLSLLKTAHGFELRKLGKTEASTIVEQPAQEPVAWIIQTEKLDGTLTEQYAMMGKYKYVADSCDFVEPIPLYTHPAPSWQGNKEFVRLSDDEKLAIIRKWKDAHTMRAQELIGLGDAFEQALKEKNNAM